MLAANYRLYAFQYVVLNQCVNWLQTCLNAGMIRMNVTSIFLNICCRFLLSTIHVCMYQFSGVYIGLYFSEQKDESNQISRNMNSSISFWQGAFWLCQSMKISSGGEKMYMILYNLSLVQRKKLQMAPIFNRDGRLRKPPVTLAGSTIANKSLL